MASFLAPGVIGGSSYLAPATPPATGDTAAPIFTGTLVQTAVTSTSCTINWSGTTHTDNVGITGYEYSVNGGIYYALGNVLSYTFTGFTASTTYTISLRAFDAAGNRSTVLSITTMTSAPSIDTTPPTMVGSLLSSAITSTSFNLSWQAATDNVAVTGYEVSTDGATYTNIGNVLTITETGRASSTTYPCLVRAYDAAGNKSIPLSLSVTTLAAGTVTPPQPPPSQYINNFFLVTLGSSNSTCARSPCCALIAGEYGIQFNVGMNFDMSAQTSLSLKFTRPDGTTLTVAPTLGAVPLITPLNLFAANTYATYVIAANDLPVDGGYQMRLTYVDAYKRLVSPVINFAVSP